MNQKKHPKPDYPMDISIEILYFASRLLQEHGSLNWVPGWLVRTLGIYELALGIIVGQKCIIHLAGNVHNSEMDSMEIAVDQLWCCQQDSLETGVAPCHVFACPVRKKVMERGGQAEQATTCFPLAGKKGFLMACKEGLQQNSFPDPEMLKAFTHLIANSMDAAKSAGKAASYFLPSEDMAQMWSEMLAGLSHDLRTPLACIKGYVTTLLREDVTWDPVTQKEFLNIIVEETDHIENLINNLLDSATFSWKGEVELKKEPVLLTKIVNKVLRDPSYRSKNHQFTVLFPENFPFIEADPVRIEQVLRNIVDNAVKYSMENTRIVIKGDLAPDEVIVSVADQGIGIDDEHLNRLFEKFFRVTNGLQGHQKGMGLGLPLIRQVLISHGGRIWAKSKLNQGTVFYFALPYGLPGIKLTDSGSRNDRGLSDEA